MRAAPGEGWYGRGWVAPAEDKTDTKAANSAAAARTRTAPLIRRAVGILLLGVVSLPNPF
jgi:hypothetical protein